MPKQDALFGPKKYGNKKIVFFLVFTPFQSHVIFFGPFFPKLFWVLQNWTFLQIQKCPKMKIPKYFWKKKPKSYRDSFTNILSIELKEIGY